MNRLWIRFSLVIMFVVLFLALLPAMYRVGIQLGLVAKPALIRELPDIMRTLPPETVDHIQEAVQQETWLFLTRAIAIAAVIGIAAGVGLSRTLTAPLRQLEEGAQAIAAQELSFRVPVAGSQEIQSVATAFNQMAARLEQAETLRRNLLADVAHELRNPLHVLQGNLQAILDDVYPLSKEEIARLADQTRHLTTLVDDLHELAQAEAHRLPLQRQMTDMAVLVKEAADTFRPLATTRHITIQVELLGTVPALQIDAARIRQALHNLLSNALRHTPEGGKVTVTVEQSGGTLQVRVQDTGAGIAPEHLAHVFDRFYRADSARSRDRGGTGLGLAIVRAIVEAHGGSITPASAGLNQGSTFIMSLPAGQ